MINTVIDISTITTIAGFLGISAPRLINLVRSAMTGYQKKRQLALIKDRKVKYPEIIKNRLPVKLVNRYYDTSYLKDIRPLCVETKAGLIETQLVVPKGWDSAEITRLKKLCSPSSLGNETPTYADFLLDDHTIDETIDISPESVSNIIAGIELRDAKVWDNPVYRLWDINIGDGCLQAHFIMTRFMIYRLTVGALWDEAIDALIDAKMNIDTILNSPERYMPLRSQLLPDCKAFTDIKHALCVGGPSVVLAMARENDFAVPLLVRSSRVSAGHSMLSLVPQGFHQPEIDPKLEVGITSSIFRELFEELLGGKEAVRGDTHINHDWFIKECDGIRWFLEHPESYQLELLSVGRNILNNNYEFGVLLTILDEDYWKKFGNQMAFNWECDTSGTRKCDTGRLLSTRDSDRISELLIDPAWTEGLAFFAQGMNRLRKIDPNRF